MEKIIKIDGKEIPLKSTASTLIRYKAQFGRDGLKDLFSLVQNTEKLKSNNEDINIIEDIDIDTLTRFTWVFAKTANNDILPFMEWLDSFETFPILDVSQELIDLISNTLTVTTKKN